MKIDTFRGDFEYLSNMSNFGFIDNWGAAWKTNEHWYQAAKTPHPLLKMLIWDAPTGQVAKRLANDPDVKKKLFSKEIWLKEQDSVMLNGLFMKFEQNLEIREKLISTFGFELIEGNTWHDNYWGDCSCDKCKDLVGVNQLGKLLTVVRNKYRVDDRIDQLHK